jgi:hypothetical protein
MALRDKWYSLFHELWGLNKDGIYDKKKWVELQFELESLDADITERTHSIAKSFLNITAEELLKKIREHFQQTSPEEVVRRSEKLRAPESPETEKEKEEE